MFYNILPRLQHYLPHNYVVIKLSRLLFLVCYTIIGKSDVQMRISTRAAVEM